MIWDVPHTLAFLSKYYELLPGDLIFTRHARGRRRGGRRATGSTGRIEGLTPLSIEIAPPVAARCER